MLLYTWATWWAGVACCSFACMCMAKHTHAGTRLLTILRLASRALPAHVCPQVSAAPKTPQPRAMSAAPLRVNQGGCVTVTGLESGILYVFTVEVRHACWCSIGGCRVADIAHAHGYFSSGCGR